MDGSFNGKGVPGVLVPLSNVSLQGNALSEIPMIQRHGDNGQLLDTTQIVSRLGIHTEGCAWHPGWQAFECEGNANSHEQLVMESMDADSMTRKFTPVTFTTSDHSLDFLNGPMDHGICYFPGSCLLRLSTFYGVVRTGMVYDIHTAGAIANHLRFHMLNADESSQVLLKIHYRSPLRLDVYKSGQFIEPNNAQFQFGDNGEENYLYMPDSDAYVPTLDTLRFSGENYWQRLPRVLNVVIRGSTPIEIVTAPVVQLTFTTTASVDSFFEQNLLQNLAFVLNIEPTSIVRVRDPARGPNGPGPVRRRPGRGLRWRSLSAGQIWEYWEQKEKVTMINSSLVLYQPLVALLAPMVMMMVVLMRMMMAMMVDLVWSCLHATYCFVLCT